MRDEELMSLVLGVVLIGLLMAGGVWAFMRWATPPDDPYAVKGRLHRAGHERRGSRDVPETAPGHAAPTPHARVHQGEHARGHRGAPARGRDAPVAAHAEGRASHHAAPGWPVKPRNLRPTAHASGH
jgi:hypothetical protein